ncbi:hypothetical protein [Kosakonia oryziphila]|uniref:Uncharacterized protein n=1 Tax=Kosakonia oryziphila TaxID=1005667 RepID=A0A1C4DVE5_9ENTR|nr:hypothetical protein [Kosakonia oryziphila]SCC35309.1 hypothetical protein GA0061070_101886 [Kosakonia oryziphila]
MDVLPRLTPEKLASLPPGTRIKFGGQIVKLVGRGTLVNAAGRTETIIEYTDSRGVNGSFEEKIFLQTATQYLNSVRCDMCGQLRDKRDCEVKVVETYMTRSNGYFCQDSKCADRYFLIHPNQKPQPGRRKW